MPRLHIYKNEKETCYAFAEWFAELVSSTLENQQKFTVALPGTDVPRLLFKLLSTEFAEKIDWEKIHVFLDNENSTAAPTCVGGLNEPLNKLLETLSLPRNQINIIGSDLPPEGSALQHGDVLNNYFINQGISFDLAILGLTEDGSFSWSAVEESSQKNGVSELQEDMDKLALNSNIINAAAIKAFVITGKRKQDAVQQVLKGKYDPGKYPAQLIQTVNRTVHWFLDEAAAGRLIKPAP